MNPVLKQDIAELRRTAVQAVRLIHSRNNYTVGQAQRIAAAQRQLALLIRDLEQ